VSKVLSYYGIIIAIEYFVFGGGGAVYNDKYGLCVDLEAMKFLTSKKKSYP